MKRIVFITPHDARYGFSLTGVRQLVAGPETLERTVLELFDDLEIGVVAIDERLIQGPSQDRLRQLEQRWPGLLIVLPAPQAAETIEEDYAMRLIRRAIGYQVRLGL